MSSTRKTGGRAPGKEAAALVAHVQARREEERSHIARVLHRDVSGMLAAARMDLSRVAGAGIDEAQQQVLQRLDGLLDKVIRDVRAEMQRLHPALLDHFGLPAAMRHLVEESCRAREVRYSHAFDEPYASLDAQLQVALYRLVETWLEQGPALAEFKARLTARRDGCTLEIDCVAPPAAGTLEFSDAFRRELDALRAWLHALGAKWRESREGLRATVELRFPCVPAADAG